MKQLVLQETVRATGLGIRRLRRDTKNWTPLKKLTHQKQKVGEGERGKEKKGREGGKDGGEGRKRRRKRKMLYVHLYDFMWYLSVIYNFFFLIKSHQLGCDSR